MSIDQLFQQAVALIGMGDVGALDQLLTDHPELARERLTLGGSWRRRPNRKSNSRLYSPH
jgi:hypothetical protein